MTKELYEILYDRLPEIYRKEDAEVPLNPYPLKRFFQIAFEGVKPLEKKIQNVENLFNVGLTDAKNLDTLGELLGLTFPKGTLEEEKRRIIKNLPQLYKMKGTDTVYGVLAKLVFHKDAKTNILWSYDGFPRADIEVLDTIEDLDGKQTRFLELLEHFRTPNTKIGWVISIIYLYEVKIKTEDTHKDVMVSVNGLLNYGRLNENLILNGEGQETQL